MSNATVNGSLAASTSPRPHLDRKPHEVGGIALLLVRDWTVSEFDLARARDLVKASGYKGDPAYTALHQNATFTAKLHALKWRAAPTFAMDFRAPNWG